MNEKERRLAGYCRTHGVDGVWLRRRTNIAWLTDGADVHVDSSSSTGVASLLWTPKKKLVLTTNIEARRLADEEFGSEWEVQAHNWWEKAAPPKGNFATDFPDDPFADLRSPLTDLELKRIRELAMTAARDIGALLHGVNSSMTELDLANQIRLTLGVSGIYEVPVLLVAADERISKYRHPIPTENELGETVMVAVCPRQYGLTVAFTRLVHLGKKVPPKLREKHEAVCKVDAAFHAATKPGVRWCDILKTGIRAYCGAGYPKEWKLHHQGGPMGYEGRDFKATPTEMRRVVENQAVGWNPSITGTKSEDTILSSGEVLTEMKDWPMCGSRPDILCRG